MQVMNDGFFHMMDLNDEYRLKTVFWANAQTRVSYEYYGNVVTFDMMYLTNRYLMSFAHFVRVNHHSQPILFGAWLLSSFVTVTFVWLFETCLKCMNDRVPSVIIPDQDRTMKSAIVRVFSRARHRFCLWHILKNLPKKIWITFTVRWH